MHKVTLRRVKDGWWVELWVNYVLSRKKWAGKWRIAMDYAKEWEAACV